MSYIKLMTGAELDRLASQTGCSEHDDCLTCPLPNCIYDSKHNIAAKHLEDKDEGRCSFSNS